MNFFSVVDIFLRAASQSYQITPAPSNCELPRVFFERNYFFLASPKVNAGNGFGASGVPTGVCLSALKIESFQQKWEKVVKCGNILSIFTSQENG
jgi:hypothetical protein